MPTIVGGANDGYCASGIGNWTTVRTHAGATFDSNNSYDVNAVSVLKFIRRGNHSIRRAFFEFDTSGISKPLTATLKVMGVTNTGADVIAVRSDQGGTLSAGDFDSFENGGGTGDNPAQALLSTNGSGAGTFAGLSNFTYSAEISTWGHNVYNDIELNGTAIEDMFNLDTFKVCLMEYDNDYLDIDGGTISNWSGIRWSEGGVDKHPYIDYTVAADNAIFFGANF
jgi:hypothetical protein